MISRSFSVFRVAWALHFVLLAGLLITQLWLVKVCYLLASDYPAKRCSLAFALPAGVGGILLLISATQLRQTINGKIAGRWFAANLVIDFASLIYALNRSDMILFLFPFLLFLIAVHATALLFRQRFLPERDARQ